MPAYAAPISQECSQDRCTKTATHEVRNNRNEPIRKCCKKHADLLVNWLNKQAQRE